VNQVAVVSERDLSLDFVKGVLVVVMVIYHTMNYFSTAKPENYGYIRFVSGSFIFISGYLVATHYRKKYNINRRAVTRRLIVRGVKLLGVFTALNVLMSIVGVENHKSVRFGFDAFIANLPITYGTGNSRITAFQILVPIAYLLMISPIVLAMQGWKKLVFCSILILSGWYEYMGNMYFNPYLVLIGMFGLSFGILFDPHHQNFRIHRILALIVLVVSVSNMSALDQNIYSYTLGIILVLLSVYMLSKSMRTDGHLFSALVLLGNYTLLSYIAQIVFLFALYLFLRQRWDMGYETLSVFAATILFLFLMCLALDWLRKRNQVVDTTYRAIFS